MFVILLNMFIFLFCMFLPHGNENDNKILSYIPFISTPFPLTDKLKTISLKYFLNKNPSISDLLEHPSIFVEFMHGNENLISYLINNLNDFINILFSSSDKHSIVAYSLAKINLRIITNSIGKSPSFYISAINIISQDPIDSILLNRLMYITSIIIKESSDSFPPNCGYILQLFQAISNYGVVSFFDNILQPQQQLFHVQNWLNEVDFYKIVAEEINKTEPKGDPYFDVNTLKYLSLLSIVRVCAKSQSLSDAFHSAKIIEAVSRPLCKNCFHSAIDEQWITINELYNEKIIDIMRGFFHQAILMIENNDKKTLKAKEAAIHFITKIIENDELMIQFFINANIEPALLRILIEYSSNTFIVNAILDLVKTGMKNFSIAPMMASTFLSPLIYEATESNSNYMREISIELIDWCSKFEATNDWFSIILQQIKQFKNFELDSLQKWREMIKPCKT